MKKILLMLLLFPLIGFGQFNPIFFYGVKFKDAPLFLISLRKVNTLYSGDCIRVRRDSDNTELNIGFVGGVLDTSTLLSFVGAGNGHVVIWYDQAGTAKNFIQSTQASQPVIVDTGVLVTLNGKPAIKCNSVQFLATSTFTMSANDIMSGVIVAAKLSDGAILSSVSASGYHHFRALTTDIRFRHNGTNAIITDSHANGVQNLYEMVRYDASNVRYYRNNSLKGDQPMSETWGGRDVAIGRASANSPNSSIYQEVRYYNYNIISGLSIINSEINSFYGIY